MKRLILSLAVACGILCSGLAITAPAYAANIFPNTCSGSGNSSTVCDDRTSSNPLAGPNGVINRVSRIIAFIAGITAVIIIIVGGFMYILSAGDTAKTSQAKDLIIYAAVGLVVVVLAQSIVTFIVNRLG